MDNLLRWHTIGRDDQGWAVRLALPADVPLQMVASRDATAYANFRDRYRDMAKTRGFEGHIAWAEEMP
jgi:hypothetical protein